MPLCKFSRARTEVAKRITFPGVRCSRTGENVYITYIITLYTIYGRIIFILIWIFILFYINFFSHLHLLCKWFLKLPFNKNWAINHRNVHFFVEHVKLQITVTRDDILNKEHVGKKKKIIVYLNELITRREILQNRFSHFQQFLCKPADDNRWLNFVSTFRQAEDNGYPFFRQIFPVTLSCCRALACPPPVRWSR